jgi:hypothetical protein
LVDDSLTVVAATKRLASRHERFIDVLGRQSSSSSISGDARDDRFFVVVLGITAVVWETAVVAWDAAESKGGATTTTGFRGRPRFLFSVGAAAETETPSIATAAEAETAAAVVDMAAEVVVISQKMNGDLFFSRNRK